MKNSFKRVFATVLALAMIFSTFGIVVSADTTVTIDVTEKKLEQSKTSNDIYEMSFNLTAPAAVKTAQLIFSYDSEAIQPVNRKASTNYADVTLTDSNYDAFNKYSYYDSDEEATIQYDWVGGYYYNIDGRTGVNVTVSNTNGIAAAGIPIIKFYYRIKDTSKMNRETFRFETATGAGSILEQAFVDAAKRNGIYVLDATDAEYLYGENNNSVVPTWTYTNSDKEPAAAKTPVDISVITIEGAKEVKLPATLALTLGNVPAEGVTAELQYEVDGVWGTTAPTAEGTYNVKVVATAAEGYVVTGTAATATVTILAADPVEETKDLEITAENGTTAGTLKVGDKEYKDLFVVDAAIKHGLEAGKTIVKWGVKFHDAANMTKGGGIVEFTPETTEITVEGELTFKAAIIGVPDGVTVKAVPFVVSK